MLDLSEVAVVNMCLACVLVAYYYTGTYKVSTSMCRKALFILSHARLKPQPFPHKINQFNSLNQRLTHVTHRTYKNKDYLYKLIIIKNMEDL